MARFKIRLFDATATGIVLLIDEQIDRKTRPELSPGEIRVQADGGVIYGAASIIRRDTCPTEPGKQPAARPAPIGYNNRIVIP